jgi:putative transposase
MFSRQRSRFSMQQIAFALQQAGQGTQVADVSRTLGISDPSFCRGKQKFGGLMPSEVRKLRQLEEEKARQIQADHLHKINFSENHCHNNNLSVKQGKFQVWFG